MIAGPSIFKIAPEEPVWPLWVLRYDRYCAGLFSADFGHSQIPGQNPTKITLHGICHSSAPIKATKVLKVPFKDNWPSNI